VNKYPDLGTMDNRCASLSAVPQARSNFQFDRQQLLLSFPQSSINNSARGWVDPILWDDGIPAALLNYSISGAHNTSRSSQGSDSESQYANLRPGLNLDRGDCATTPHGPVTAVM
jgi:outer membrane usher protein